MVNSMNIPFTPRSFRDMINHCTRNKPWLTFGCDLALGSPTDRIATTHEMMFLPLYLKEAFATATITQADGHFHSVRLLQSLFPDHIGNYLVGMAPENLFQDCRLHLVFHSGSGRRRAVFPKLRFDASMRLSELEYHLVTTF